jgi:hypothetical protein
MNLEKNTEEKSERTGSLSKKSKRTGSVMDGREGHGREERRMNKGKRWRRVGPAGDPDSPS